MALHEIKIPPGIVKDTTRYSAKGQWVDSQWSRFRLGLPESIGGWNYYQGSNGIPFTDRLNGITTAIHQWADNSGTQYTAFGTNSSLYVYRNVDNPLYYIDITPLSGSPVALGLNPLRTDPTPGSGWIQVYVPSGVATKNDVVVLSGATGFDGYTAGQLNNIPFPVVSGGSGPGAFWIYVGGTAVAGDVFGGGAAVTVQYRYPGGGWTDSPLVTSQEPLRQWTLDNFGEYLIAGIRNGPIWYWNPSAGWTASNRAANITSIAGSENAPTVCTGIIVSEIDRHLIVYGANPIGSANPDPLLVRWSNQEDILTWTPDTDNTAGDYKISTGSKIITATRSKQETLMWTDVAFHSMSFTGPPYTFGFNLIAENTSIISPNAFSSANNRIFWMDRGEFKSYDGSVNLIPSPVQDYVFNGIAASGGYNVDLTCSGTNSKFNEIWWFYQGHSDTSDTFDVNDSYVIYNYAENVWSVGAIVRTAWSDSGDTGKPIGAWLWTPTIFYDAVFSYIFSHEYGPVLYDPTVAPYYFALPASIGSGDMDIGSGQEFTFIKRIFPDYTRVGVALTTEGLTHEISYRNTNGENYTVGFTGSAVPTTGQMFCRVRGRQIKISLSSNSLRMGWRLGTVRLDTQKDGQKS